MRRLSKRNLALVFLFGFLVLGYQNCGQFRGRNSVGAGSTSQPSGAPLPSRVPSPTASPAVSPTLSPGISPTPSPMNSPLPTPDVSGRPVKRGDSFFGAPEKFNRYYTDTAWTPVRTVYVSPTGGGTGASSGSPLTMTQAFTQVAPGDLIRMTKGTYNGCYELGSTQSGTYDQPIVIYGERNGDNTLGVTINCCSTGRQTCLNFEQADYIAVDGVKVVGGNYGIRGVGNLVDNTHVRGQPLKHQKGLAWLNNDAGPQYRDPLFTGQSSWIVVENNIAHSGGAGDGHGVYLSNGGDYFIFRKNRLFNNRSSDFQINADPLSTCQDMGISFTDPLCHGLPEGNLGAGMTDYALIEQNLFFHSRVGNNYDGLRNSIIRNNVYGWYRDHGISFYQEPPTAVPELSSDNNDFSHNLIVMTNSRETLQFLKLSEGNRIHNNLVVGVTVSGTTVTANPGALLLTHQAATLGKQTFSGNVYLGGKHTDYDTGAVYPWAAGDNHVDSFSKTWFQNFPLEITRYPATDFSYMRAFNPADLIGVAGGGNPFVGVVPRLPLVLKDFFGSDRTTPTDVGPFLAP